MIAQYSKEMYDALDFFERNAMELAYVGAIKRESKENWKRGYYFTDGKANDMFRAFLAGINYGMDML